MNLRDIRKLVEEMEETYGFGKFKIHLDGSVTVFDEEEPEEDEGEDGREDEPEDEDMLIEDPQRFLKERNQKN